MVYGCPSYILLSQRRVTWRDKLSIGDELQEGAHIRVDIHTIGLSNTKLNNDQINLLVGLTYHHFVVHSIVVMVVLIPSNLTNDSAVRTNVGGTSKNFHRDSNLAQVIGMLK